MADNTEVSMKPEEMSAIDWLAPGTAQHAKLLSFLRKRIEMSENAMSKFYARWRVAERKIQAYIDLPDYEKLLKEMNQRGEPPNATSITVPYAFATIWTIVTYLTHVFAGRKPMFPIGSHKAETVQSAQKMETVLQYQADHTRMVKRLIQFFFDDEVYGVGVLRTLWKEERKMRTVRRAQSPLGTVMPGSPQQAIQQKEERLVYEGNDVLNVDPFMFFPDPRVPMCEVNKRGEFVFWRNFEGRHSLIADEFAGLLKWVDNAPKLPQGGSQTSGSSVRDLISKGDAHPGDPLHRDAEIDAFYQVDQGTVTIIPAELGLSESTRPEKWLFTILNKGQIVQAEPFDADHDMHPVAVAEGYSMGYGFGQPGMGDMLGPIQDMISWFMNSHVHNVRSVINNQIVVDPSMVEMQDVKNPEPGKVIRLKRSAYGQDVRTAFQQLPVQDVTAGHVGDMREFIRMGDSMSSVNDNIRGTPQTGGRKTATEMRIAGEAGSSRLAAHAKLISAQAIVDMTEQMCINTQQYQTEAFYLSIVGESGRAVPLTIQPEMLVGDFHYPVSDGTLPIDKGALLDVWREILFGVAGDPVLRQQFDLMEMFEWVAELGGAKNLGRFKLDEGSMQQQLQQMTARLQQLEGQNGQG